MWQAGRGMRLCDAQSSGVGGDGGRFLTVGTEVTQHPLTKVSGCFMDSKHPIHSKPTIFVRRLHYVGRLKV